MATLNIKNFPEPLLRRLKERARREHRSMAQQVTHLLEQILEEPEPVVHIGPRRPWSGALT